MSESELMSAASQALQLSYLVGQWWVTLTTAFVVSIFFGAKMIPRWLFVLIIVLYCMTVFSVIVESLMYGQLAADYMGSLQVLRQARNAGQIPQGLAIADAVPSTGCSFTESTKRA